MTDPLHRSAEAVKLHQPRLLRLLHGATALAVLLAWLSGTVLLIRFGSPSAALQSVSHWNLIDFHGESGEILIPIAAVFAFYALTLGQWRLHRASNATPLLALALALVSGQFMEEDWVFDGPLHHPLYGLHVIAWLLLGLSVLWHVGAVVKRGGWALATSMLHSAASVPPSRDDSPTRDSP